MSWDAEVQELQRRRYLAQQQGGEAGIAKQHARGRMTIRERIGVLLDEGSFREHGRATASPVYDDNDELIEYVPANYIVGFGTIEGRRVTVGGEDFTPKGGSPNAAGLRKSVYAEHLAVQYRTPWFACSKGVAAASKAAARKAAPWASQCSRNRTKIIADAMGVVPVASAAAWRRGGFSSRTTRRLTLFSDD